jgi:hypothetical protein
MGDSCPFKIQFESAFSRPALPRDFSIILNGQSFLFNRTSLASFSRRVSTLLISDPLANSIVINDELILPDCVSFLFCQSELTESTVVGVAILGVFLQSDPLFDFAIRSLWFSALEPETRRSVIELAFSCGVDIRGVLVSASFDSEVASSEMIQRLLIRFRRAPNSKRSLVLSIKENANFARNVLEFQNGPSEPARNLDVERLERARAEFESAADAMSGQNLTVNELRELLVKGKALLLLIEGVTREGAAALRAIAVAGKCSAAEAEWRLAMREWEKLAQQTLHRVQRMQSGLAFKEAVEFDSRL